MVRFFARLFCLFVLISALLTSCQKDDSVKNLKADTQLQADSAKKLNTVSTPGNYLVSKGTLTIKVQDSTYTFNAEEDSIAFVNITINGSQYYGLTAINKAHTVSFGISSSAVPIAEVDSYVSGCQFLLRSPGKTNLEYTLTRNVSSQGFGTISIEQYNQDNILAKGTFRTYLAKDTKPNSSFYIADGTFELKMQ
jgi:hypothetical protein